MTLRSRTVDAVFGAAELVASLYDWIRSLRKPGPKHDDQTDPIPLRRRATEQRPEIPPPPPKRAA